MKLDIKDYVGGDKVAKFWKYDGKSFYFQVENGLHSIIFEVPHHELSDVPIYAVDRSMLFMKWIKRHIDIMNEDDMEYILEGRDDY